jgi:hypothetical protein
MRLPGISRRQLTALLYVALLAAFIVLLARQPLLRSGHQRSWPLIFALGAMTALSYTTVERMLDRLGVALDAGIAIATVALVTCGPWVALMIALIPEAIRLIRRPDRERALGRLANVVSYCGFAATGAWLLAYLPSRGPWAAPLAVITIGAATAAVSYLLARLLFATLSQGAHPARLLQREFLPMLPTELAMLAVAAASTLLLPVIGVGALAPLAVIVELPQFALTRLLRVRSVAGLDVWAAAAVYRKALADELQLPRAQRGMIEQVATLVVRQPTGEYHSSHPSGHASTENLRAVVSYALELQAITGCARTPPACQAHPCVQVVLVAREWAQLTAQDTRALSHPESLAEMTVRETALNAPQALAAACALALRETALTDHTTTLPRLHALPLPRALRGARLIAGVEHLRAQPT